VNERGCEPVADEELARRYLSDPKGSDGRAAVEELFGRYHGRVFVWCFRFVRDEERAQDLAQDTMLRAFRALGSFEGRSRFSSWLYAIARNRCFNAARRVPLLRDEESDPDTLAATGRSPEDELADAEDEGMVLDLMREALEPRERVALWMRCYERMPVDEITAALGLAGASGARGLLQTARRKLRAALERRDRAGGERRS
jgi:RNA polymerase sigma-70 factor (ECF subfamily)